MSAQRLVLLLVRNTLCGALAVPLLAGPLAAQDPPYSVDQLSRLVQSRAFAEERILSLTEQSCLGFRLDEAVEGQLRAAGASDELLVGLREVCVVLPYAVETIQLVPRQLELRVGAVQDVRAEALNADSLVVEDVPLEWISTDTAIAVVVGDGVVVGKAPGEALIAARTEGGVEGTMQLVVVSDDEAGLSTEREDSKSVATAAVLGVVAPGGGEFYTGNTGKGAVVALGSAAALAAAFLLASEDTTAAAPVVNESCEDTSCSVQIATMSEVQTSGIEVAGVAMAAALWVYGLVDGVLAAGKTTTPSAEPASSGEAAFSAELLPSDGIRVTRAGGINITLLRIR